MASDPHVLHSCSSDKRPENSQYMQPSNARALFRKNYYTGYTSGFCSGYAQTNILILPKEYANDFEELCKQNPGAFPLLYRSQPGEVGAPVLAVDSNVVTDLPRYIVCCNGCITGETFDLSEFDSVWNDYVTFYIGCSSTFDTVLVQNGVKLPNILDIPMYTSNVSICPAGPFQGKMSVTMRAIPKHQMVKAFMISSQYPDHHGAPIHIGDPSRIGISDIDFQDGDVPMFWACGFTVQEVVSKAKPHHTFYHYPGSMFITDVEVEPILLDDTVEIVQLSRANDAFFASVINHKSLAIFEQLEQTLLDRKRLISKSNLLKASLSLSHAKRVVVNIGSQTFSSEEKMCGLSSTGAFAICQALLALDKEVTLIVKVGSEKFYKSCIDHMVEIGVYKASKLPVILSESKMSKMLEQMSSTCTYDCLCNFQDSGSLCVKPIDEMTQHVTTIDIDSRDSETGLNTLADFHISDFAGNSGCGGHALACGLYVASISPLHWRYKNFAIKSNPLPHFNLHTFLPTTEQEMSLWKHMVMNHPQLDCLPFQVHLDNLSDIIKLSSNATV